MTLGSLFDGIGGFPLAGVMCGITPMWASEIEPFPMKVTAARFPEMKQLGSVTDIDGGAVEPVDIITFGSPCQDLSVAGKQLGIHEGQRSNLFFEAVRIIKEMRAADERIGRTDKHIRPRFAVWENVPGAFSSNKGADFKAVLEALAGVIEADVSIPQPKRWDTGGVSWETAGAWPGGSMTLNTGECPSAARESTLSQILQANAPEKYYLSAKACAGILRRAEKRGKELPPMLKEALEEAVSLSRNAPENLGGGKGILPAVGRAFTLATNVDQSVCYQNGEPICLNFQGNKSMCSATQDGTAYSLMAMHGHDVHVICKENDCAGGSDGIRCLNPWDGQNMRLYDTTGSYPTLRNNDGGGGRCDGVCYPVTARTLAARHDSSPCVDRGQNVVCYDARGNGDGDTAPTLTGDHEQRVTDYTAVCVGNGQLHQTDMGDKAGALNCMHDQQAVVTNGNPPRKYIIRRLTPTECARLQGFPDDWCEGLGGSDSAIYKAYGNGLALPCAYDVLRRIAKEANSE